MPQEDRVRQTLAFMKLDEAAQAALAGAKSTIEALVRSALGSFYNQVRSFPEVRKFFRDDKHMDAASAAQSQHWGHIATGRFDASYIQSVLRIGQVHARIGLEPRWFIGGYALILDGVIRGLIGAHAKTRRFMRPESGEVLAGELTAVVKAALLDIDLAISTYLQAAEEARKVSEKAAIAASEKLVVDSFGAALAMLAGCDLTTRMDHKLPEAYVALQADFNAAMTRLSDTLAQVSGNTAGMKSGAAEISQAADDLAQRTEQQAAALEQTAAALGEITAAVKQTAQSAAQARAMVSVAKDEADKIAGVVRGATEAMDGISKSAQEISQIIAVMDEIAFQTSLLALNAGVEAARAGESGRGFAVVASEVRALADRSAKAAKEIKELISGSSRQVQSGVALVGETGEALSRIVGKVNEIDMAVSAIATSAQTQATGLSEVNVAISEMDNTTQQNAAMVQQSTAASHALAEEATTLSELVSVFKLGNTDSAHSPGGSRPQARRA